MACAVASQVADPQVPNPKVSNPQGSTEVQQEDPVIRSTTRLVVLDVVVTDAHSHPVGGLKGQDFGIVEDGVEQKVASFEAPASRRSSTARGTGADAARADAGERAIPAHNIMVLDELNTEVLDESYARQSIEKYLRKHGPVLNEPTSLLIVGQDNLEFAHDYTRDAAALKTALHGHHAALPFALETGGAYGAVERLSKTLWVLKQIASANLHYAGRKNVIWIGSGFPELTLQSIAAHDRAQFQAAIRDMASVLFDARVAVYTIDPQGLQVAPAIYEDTFGDLTTGELLFEGIAEQTGGKIVRLRNEIDEAISESMEDGASYYTLTYYPSNHTWNGKFRNLRVAVKGRELHVRARKGYYALADSPLSDSQVDGAVSQALMSPLPYRALDVQASVTRAEESSGKYTLLVNPNGLEWETLASGKRRCQVTVVTATVGAGSQFSTHKVRQLESVVDAQQFRKIFSKAVTFTFVAELPADTHLVKVVARDSGNGNIGTAEISRDSIRSR
jgi:VWFA-related protein